MAEGARQALLIKRHDVSDVVELTDGSKWRIWPGGWLPNTPIEISATDDGNLLACPHQRFRSITA
jgi:hypothetical protein